MSPKEKAEELINKYYLDLKQDSVYYDLETARICTLTCVNEIIKVTPYEDFRKIYRDVDKQYWQEVKQEIENYEGSSN